MAMEDQKTSADQDFGAQFLRNRKQRRMRRVIAFLVVVAGAGGYYYWNTQQEVDTSADETLIVTIGYGDIENAIPAAGSLQPKEIVPVGARASGELVDILVDVGADVEEGQILAQIDAEEQRLRVDSSELNIQSQRNQLPLRENSLEKAKRDYERTLALHEAGAATDQELESQFNNLLSAQNNLDNLLIQIRQSETSLEQERVQLNYTEIKAPLSGTVISLDQKEGATLNASQTAPTVMQIADLSVMSVETEISEADIAAIEEGVEVYFTTLGSGDRRWYGTLRQIDPLPTVSNNVVLFKGRFDVDNSERDLFPGMTTQVFFVTSSAEDVLTVPLGALTFTDTPTMSENGARPNREEVAAATEGFGRGGEITPEMRERFEQMRQSGGFEGGGRGGFPGGGRGGFPGGDGGFPGGFGDGGQGAGAAGGSILGSISLNEPRNATVEVVLPGGTRETREIVVGASDRVNAEVISGLEAGDRVVAGVIQERLEEDDDDNNNNSWRGPGGMRGFGF